jgi:hypothetical protein
MGDVDLSRHNQFLIQRKIQESMVASAATAFHQIKCKAIDGGNIFLDKVLPFHDNAMASGQTENDIAAVSIGIHPPPQDTSPTFSVVTMGVPPAPCDSSPVFSVYIPPAPQDTSPVNVPGGFDILLGRGRSFQNHKGNLRYRQIVEFYRERYESMATKREKTRLIKEVVQVIFDGGGRFVQQDSVGRWMPVDLEMSRDKVSHSFRNQRRLSQKGNTAFSPAKSNDVASKQVRSADMVERDAKRARNIVMEEEQCN